MSSSARASARVMISIFPSTTGSERSRTVPSMAMATAFLASDFEMDSATSRPVAPASKLRTEPSGNVREIGSDIDILLHPVPPTNAGGVVLRDHPLPNDLAGLIKTFRGLVKEKQPGPRASGQARAPYSS